MEPQFIISAPAPGSSLISAPRLSAPAPAPQKNCIEDNAKYHRLKSNLERDFAAAVHCLRPPPLIGFCLGVVKQFC